MAEFKYEDFSSEEEGKKFIFSNHDEKKWGGPGIIAYPDKELVKYVIFNKNGKYKFEFSLDNSYGASYSAKIYDNAGYPIGLTMIVDKECLYFGEISSKTGFEGIVYRFKHNEKIKIQKYHNGLLIDECIHNAEMKTDIAPLIPYFHLPYNKTTVKKTISNKNGEEILFITGHDDITPGIGAKIDFEGSITLGNIDDNEWCGLIMKTVPAGLTHIKTYDRNLPDGQFELTFFNEKRKNNTIVGYSLLVKKAKENEEDEDEYINLIYKNQNGKNSMKIYHLNSNKKIKSNSSTLVLPDDIYRDGEGVNSIESFDEEEKGEEKLEQLIGLDNVKKEIKKMKAVLKKFKHLPEKSNLNMVFYGNPGTGKTVVARIVADILFEAGILPKRGCLEIDSSGLIGQYTGQTAPQTHKVFNDAMGKVLFIDEAYMLSNGIRANGGNFGKEAIAALLKDMEDYRGKSCVILAGYKEEMEEMMRVNPGFKSRINRYIDFPDYSLDELKQIIIFMYKEKGYEVEEEALNEILKIISYYKCNPNFSNAREVRNILDSLYEIQALRTEETPEDMKIILDDVLEYEKDQNIIFGKQKAKKKEWNIDSKEFIELANKSYNFKFDSSYIKEASVNIICYKNGKKAGEGSGFIISPKGIIGTCAHVVEGADSILAIVNIKTTNGGFVRKGYGVDIISLDSKADVALIGIINPEIEYPYYPLPLPASGYPELMSEIAMGGFPFGGNRFTNISLTDGKIQAINKDKLVDDDITKLFVDISGKPGSSGSGIILKDTGKCVGVFAGTAISGVGSLKLTMNYAIPIDYLWSLILKLKAKEKGDEIVSDTIPLDYQPISFISKNKMTSYLPSLKTKNNKNYNIKVIKGDISLFKGDVIVNAANKYLAPSSGVCDKIFNAAGYDELKQVCENYGECEAGKLVVTRGFNLDARYIFHAVAPHYLHDKNPEMLLEKLYENIFETALNNNVKTIAIPPLSIGIARLPLDKAVQISINVIKKYSNKMECIYLYFSKNDEDIYAKYIKELY